MTENKFKKNAAVKDKGDTFQANLRDFPEVRVDDGGNGGGEDEDGEERRDKLSAKARQISQRCQRLSGARLIHPAPLLHSLSVWPRPTCMTPDHSSSPRPFITPVTPILPLPAPRPRAPPPPVTARTVGAD